MNKDEIRAARAQPFSANVDLGPDDRIMEMISRRDGLYIVSLNKIVRVNTPDNIDPNLEHENAPIAQTGIIEKGSRSPVVARTILQTKDFANWLRSEDQKQRIQDIAWEVMFCLLAFDKFLRWYNAEIDEKQKIIAGDFEKYVSGPSPFALPIIEDLETEFRSIIFIAKHALNSISELFDLLFGTDFGRGRYDKITKWADEKFGEDAPLSQMLRNDEKWIFLWTEVRNALEHPRENYYVKINNFQLLPNREPLLPTWQLKHPKLDNFRPQNLGTALENYRNNILGFFENLLLELTDRAIDLPVFLGIQDQDETVRDPDCPKRYVFVSVVPKPPRS